MDAQPVALPEVPRKSYLPELDGLRFLAFLLVFLHHSPQSSNQAGFFKQFQDWGWMGVDLFFVLSAFLITRLLLSEARKCGTISLEKFWIRRVLRIWPLYYLIVVLGYSVLPYFVGPYFGSDAYQDLVHTHLKGVLFFFSNFVTAFKGYPPSDFIALLWTVSVEEHFYLLWPILFLFLIKKRKEKWIAPLTVIATVAIIGGRAWELHRTSWFGSIIPNSFLRFDAFLIGATCAVYEEKLKNMWGSFYFILTACLLALVVSFPKIGESKYSICWQLTATALAFASLVVLSLKDDWCGGYWKKFLSLKPLVYLGKISYGLYLFHMVGYVLTNYIGHHVHDLPWPYSIIVCLPINIIVASISYFTFEALFLHLKERYFTVIPSRKF